MRRVVVACAVVALTIAGTPARAAPTFALPDVVRINISAYGLTFGIVSSSSTLVATLDGAELYRAKEGRVAVRTDARRLSGEDVLLPSGPASAGERPGRIALLRQTRFAQLTEARAVIRVPFELDALRDAEDALGTSFLRADAIRPVRFSATEGGTLSLDGKEYRGSFELLPESGDYLVINVVPTDRYLVSVVGSEVPTDWQREALAAQAVAARTYLLRHLGSHGDYDLDGDERDQAYKGITGETASTGRAVADTAGLVATYAGSPIDAFYSANAGGATENSENVWVTPLPYLRSVASPGDAIALQSSWGASSYLWEKDYTEPQLRRQLQLRGIFVGTIVGIDVVEATATGGVLRARIRGTLGSTDVVKDSTRFYFGLKSQLFTVALHLADEEELIATTNNARLTDLAGVDAERTALVVGASVTSDGGAPIVSAFRTSGYVYRLPARVVFTGKGYGHRVGMSQWGMQGMAVTGASFQDILTHYYQGIALTKIAGP